MSGPSEKAWYRHPLVWMVIVIPLTAVVGGIATMILAIQSDDGLVEDDYYQRGKEINQMLDRDYAAASLGLAAQVRLDDESLTVELSASAGYALPPRLTLDLMHATRAGYDQRLELTQTKSGIYTATLPALVAGRWNLQLAAEDWRLTGNLIWPQTRAIRLPMRDR